MDMDISAHSLRDQSAGAAVDNEQSGGRNIASEADEVDYKDALGANMIGSTSHRILSFKDKAPAPQGDTVNNLKVLYSTKSMNRQRKTSKLVSRHIISPHCTRTPHTTFYTTTRLPFFK